MEVDAGGAAVDGLTHLLWWDPSVRAVLVSPVTPASMAADVAAARRAIDLTGSDALLVVADLGAETGPARILLVTPARLQSFLAIVDTGSARAAAARLNVTESAVSASLAALQQEVGATLFERHGRGLRLTESGVVYASYARQILGLLDESIVAARSEAAPRPGGCGSGLSPPPASISFRACSRTSWLPTPTSTSASTSACATTSCIAWPTTTSTSWSAVVRCRAAAWSRERPARTRWSSLAAPTYDVRSCPRRPGCCANPARGPAPPWSPSTSSLGIDPPTLSLGSHGAVIASAVLGLGVSLVSADAVAWYLAEGRARAA